MSIAVVRARYSQHFRVEVVKSAIERHLRAYNGARTHYAFGSRALTRGGGGLFFFYLVSSKAAILRVTLRNRLYPVPIRHPRTTPKIAATKAVDDSSVFHTVEISAIRAAVTDAISYRVSDEGYVEILGFFFVSCVECAARLQSSKSVRSSIESDAFENALSSMHDASNRYLKLFIKKKKTITRVISFRVNDETFVNNPTFRENIRVFKNVPFRRLLITAFSSI